jgi:hypothetical protein
MREGGFFVLAVLATVAMLAMIDPGSSSPRQPPPATGLPPPNGEPMTDGSPIDQDSRVDAAVPPRP